jgi:ribosomal protein L7/L12
MSEKRAELVEALAKELGVEALTPVEVESILSLAGVAAHGTGDRTSAPLDAFLAGLAAAGGDRVAVLDDVRRRTGALAPPPRD